MNKIFLRLLCAFVWTFFLSTAAHAGPFVFKAQGLLSLGGPFIIALDFVDGDGASNNVEVFGFSTDGSATVAATSGSVSGSLAAIITLSDAVFLNEMLVEVAGADVLQFSFSVSTNAPMPGGFADAFSVFVLDPVTLLPLFDTSDLLGAGALFRLEIDGSPGGLLSEFAPEFSAPAVVWTVTAGGGTVDEPGAMGLLVLALLVMAWSLRQRRPTGRIACTLGGVAATLMMALPVQAEDLNAHVQVVRGGLTLNRISNTYDATVMVKNLSSVPLLGPLKLALASATPAHVALYNSQGRLASGADYVMVPLSDGTLVPGATASAIVRLITAGQAVTATQFVLEGHRLVSGQTATLVVQGVRASASGAPGQPVGAGYQVVVNGLARGTTNADGKLQVQVPAGPTEVSLRRPPNEGGSALPGVVAAGSTTQVTVVIDDGKEVAADSRLRLDAVQQGVLARNASRIVLRFIDPREQAVRLTALYDVRLYDVVGNATPLTSLFSVQPDGSVTASPTAFYQAVGNKSGRLRIQLEGEDADGNVHGGSADFLLSDFRVRVRLVAPPSNPTLSLAGVRVVATVLNTDLRFTAQADASGLVVLPDLPRGNLSLQATTIVGGIAHVGLGTAALNFNALVSLTMRAPADVLVSVNPISVQPLPAGLGGTTSLQVVSTATATADPARLQIDQSLAALAKLGPASQGAAVSTQVMVPSVSVNVSAATQNVVVEQAASLVVPKGVKKLILRYAVSTVEYPFYVLAQSIYNDVWSLSVLSATSGVLFEQTRQINSQLTQEPVWQPNGSTGPLKKEIDVAALTANADATVILRATSVNIGDSALTTTVSATLDASEPLVITNLAATTAEVTTNNDGSFYSVPRPSSSNTLQRTFTVDLTKPSGSTLTGISVTLLNESGGTLMTVLPDTAPGANGVEVLQQDDTSAKLKVRVTMSNPASTVAGVPPPTRDIGYRVTVKANDSNGIEITDEKDANGRRSLWRMPDGRLRYGSRDQGGDDWASRGAYNWIVTHGALLREIDDVSGEHGRNIGHSSHARGTDIDMYHFYRFPGAVSGTDNYNRLIADTVLSFGTLQQQPPANATAAFTRVAAWVAATRQGLTNLAALASVERLIYCSGTGIQGLPAGWCSGMLQTGVVSRTITTANGPETQQLNFGGNFTNARMTWRNDHNNHVHITLSPAAIGE